MPDNDNDFIEKFLDDFYSECDELLILIRRSVLALEESLDSKLVDRSVLDDLFRSFHTLKGISGMVSLSAAEALAHSLESYLRELRDGKIVLTRDGVVVLADGVASLESVISARKQNQAIPSTAAVTDRIETIAKQSLGAETPASSGAESKPSTGSSQRWQVEFTPTPQLAERNVNLNNIRARLQELGAIISAQPIVKEAGAIAFEFAFETTASEEQFAELKNDGLEFQQIQEVTPSAEEPESRPKATVAPSTVVRVDLSRLDELMRMIGELVISRTRLEDQLKEARRSMQPSDWRPLNETSLNLERQLRDLRESVMRVRMVQIGEIFERMRFVVRDLARESRKKIIVEIAGGETEIDKFLVEHLMEPLLHLVRNSVSHGLETTAKREALGKSPEGHLRLSAITSGDSVIVTISDDGRGIDRDAVHARADKSIADNDDATLLDLICQPGLSTRDEADRESGRGVGMDVVKKAVADIGGHLSLSTRKNEGTTFTIELPLTLAITEALIVSVNEQKFAVPQAAVREVLKVEPDEAKILENNEIIPYRGGVMPLIRLAKLFDMHCERDKSFHVFVVGDEKNAVGVGVDRIIGQKEIVVRGIADPLARVNGIAGATELGDQKVVLILDVPALRQFAMQARH